MGTDSTLSCFDDFIMCFASKKPNKHPVMNVRTANTSSDAVMELMRTSTDSVKGKMKAYVMATTPFNMCTYTT